MQTKDNLEAWRVFVSVARTGSINLSSLLNVSSTGTPFFSNPLIF